MPENDETPPIQTVHLDDSLDWFLQNHIEICLKTGLEMGITLTVSGAIVSGILISGKTYFDELGDSIQRGVSGSVEVAQALGKSWKQFTKIYEKPEGVDDDWEPPLPGYIHLRDARVFAPGGRAIPSNGGVLWRGKLSSIDGFSMGNLSAD